MQVKRWLARVAIPVAASGVLVVATAGAANAVTVSRTGVSVTNTRTWHTYSITNIDLTIKDTKCDANDVYTKMRVYTVLNPDGADTQKRYNSTGCNSTATINNLEWNASNRISGIRVYACVDDAGTDSCTRSGYIDNPVT